VTLLLAFLAGAAWRRWFGSARPGWAFPGYRALQIVAGIGAGALVMGASLDSLACVSAAVGFMTLPISVSRAPFLWLVNRAPWLPTTDHLPHPWKPMLQGPEPWAEALQGACLFAAATVIAGVL
jgi:hypothetical protein